MLTSVSTEAGLSLSNWKGTSTQGTRFRAWTRAGGRLTRPSAHFNRSCMAHSNATHLSELRVRNFALVEEQILSLHPGLNIITGQSGSGKSVLLEAIAQLSGAPAREEAIRTGAECAELQGSFIIGDDKVAQVSAVLEKYFIDAHGLFQFEGTQWESKTLKIERRLVYIDGERKLETNDATSKSDTNTAAAGAYILQSPRRIRSICRVNDATVPVKALRDLGDVLIDFNGQGTAASIANTDAQIELLDTWAGTGDLRRHFDDLAAELTVLLAELARLTELSPKERQELESLIDTVHEVHPLKGEDDLLKAELRRIESSRVTLETCSGLLSTLGGDEAAGTADARGGIKGNLSDATLQIKALLASVRRTSADSISQDMKEYDLSTDNEEGGTGEFQAVMRGLEEALSMCHDAEILASQAHARIADYVAFSQADPVRREECIGRLRELDRLCRLIGVHSVEEACDAAQAAFDRLDAADNSRERREEVSEKVKAVESDLADAGVRLGVIRRKEAAKLRSSVTSALSSLAMEGSRFDISITWEKFSEEYGAPMSPHALLVDHSAVDIAEEGGARYRVFRGGLDRVNFLLAAGPSEPLRPLRSVASGGETARMLLALKLAPMFRKAEEEVSSTKATNGDEVKDMGCSLQDARQGVAAEEGTSVLIRASDNLEIVDAMHPSSISIFDELDSGVGARLGAQIGAALRHLAIKGKQQVLCVTHLPHIAAYGDKHIRIRKDVSKSFGEGDDKGALKTTILVDELQDPDSRIEEISSMLGLGEVEGRNSAARMLETSTEI